MPDRKMTWSEGTDAFPAAHIPSPLLAASAQQRSNFPWLLLSEAAPFGPLWHRGPCQCPSCATGTQAAARREHTLPPVCPCTCRTQQSHTPCKHVQSTQNSLAMAKELSGEHQQKLLLDSESFIFQLRSIILTNPSSADAILTAENQLITSGGISSR